MKTVLFLTIAYPYFPGEQFIEDEMDYWAAQTSAKVVLVPLTASGTPRHTPAGMAVDLTLSQSGSFIGKLTSVVAATVSKLFWKEVRFIHASRGLKLKCLAQALWTVSSVLRIEKALKRIHSKHQSPDIAYCYWNDVQAYAAVLLKRSGFISKVVSRAHGFDVYESRRHNGYMPLKRQFIGEIDLILAISQQGKAYLEMTYGAPARRVLLSPLGVPIPTTTSSASESCSLNIVSVAFCIPLKRIDKIIDAIAAAALQLGHLNISWTHIGDGPLLSDLKLRAAEKLNSLKVEWIFTGHQTNTEVKNHFGRNCVDVFINASDFEGVPVSIMEAMSYGVPVIAPSVGGISELVSSDYGCLLCELPSVAVISAAIASMASSCKKTETRLLAKQKIINNHSAANNYQALVGLVVGQTGA